MHRTSGPCLSTARRRVLTGTALAWGATLALLAPAAQAAQSAVGLGTAGSFAVLAGSTVTNTGPSVLNGDLGVDPGAAITGFPPGTVNGTIHAADAVARQAKADTLTAFNDASSRTPSTAIAGDLGGSLLLPGVYKAASSIGITGPLTLDAQGDPSAVFIFQIGSTLTTASASSVRLINGAQPCNVFWAVGSSATLGSASTFAGTLLADASISMGDGVTVQGRALARSGAVTLINDTVNVPTCTTPASTPAAPAGPAGPSAPTLTAAGQAGTATFAPTSSSTATSLRRFGTRRCVATPLPVAVTGRNILKVVFSIGGRVVATRTKFPFRAILHPQPGLRVITARVTFTDATPAVTRTLRVRVCATTAARVTPSRRPRTPGGFTG